MEYDHTEQSECDPIIDLTADDRLMELLLLDSMYPQQFIADDLQIQNAIKNQQGSKVIIDKEISGVFHVIGRQLDLHVSLPMGYPRVKLKIHARITDGNYGNNVQKQFNDRLKTDIDNGVIMDVISAVQSAQEYWNNINITDTIGVGVNHNEDISTDCGDPSSSDNIKCDDDNTIKELSRYWIYSHHIKSMTKRKLLIDLAQDLHLNGFTHVGKPGFICVEGSRDSCESFWGQIRVLNWQKISLIDTETVTNVTSSVFTSYIEMNDNSQLFRLLEEKHCATVVKNFLGLNK